MLWKAWCSGKQGAQEAERSGSRALSQQASQAAALLVRRASRRHGFQEQASQEAGLSGSRALRQQSAQAVERSVRHFEGLGFDQKLIILRVLVLTKK